GGTGRGVRPARGRPARVRTPADGRPAEDVQREGGQIRVAPGLPERFPPRRGRPGMSADPDLDATGLRRWLATPTAELTGGAAGRTDLDRPLTELGLSSVQAVSLAAELSERTGRTLPATLVWQRPTIAGLVDELVAGPGTPERPAQAVEAGQPIGIVGAGC